MSTIQRKLSHFIRLEMWPILVHLQGIAIRQKVFYIAQLTTHYIYHHPVFN